METNTTNPVNDFFNYSLTQAHSLRIVELIDQGVSYGEAITQADNEMFSLYSGGDVFAGIVQD